MGVQLPFPIDPQLTAIAVMYRNERLIADEVMPRVSVGQREFKWNKWDLRDGMTVPSTLVGRKSAPNQVSFGYSEQASSILDYGLDDPVPNSDIQSAPAGRDPRALSTMFLRQLIALDREVRVAGETFNASNYATANKATLSGTSQWSHASSDPVAAIIDALDTVVMRPNIAVFGQAVWSKVRRHASVLEAIKSTGGAISKGTVTRQQFADLFELEQVLVGESWVNNARKGQDASMARAWGKHAAFLYRDRVAAEAGQVTWGFTAALGTPIAGTIPKPEQGLYGSQLVRVGESVREVVTATDLGYLFIDAVA